MKTIIKMSCHAFALFAFAGFAFLQQAQAVCEDGCNNALFNTWQGDDALINDTTGGGNTAFGWRALFADTTGPFNTAVGAGALSLNTTGDSNTAVGAAALLLNIGGAQNTAIGTAALVFSHAVANSAVGAFALYSNTTGNQNTATGAGALSGNTTGENNTATGFQTLAGNTTGNRNTAYGVFALLGNTTGGSNTAIGDGAGSNATTGDGNVYIGAGLVGYEKENDHTYIRNINNTSVSGAGTDTVTVDLTTGLLGHATSSQRYKEDIKPMSSASEVLYRLHPVTYRYKKEIDRSQSPAFGLIAEQVATVNPNLVARNSQGQPESIHYEMVNAMLLNEFLKEHRKVETLEVTVAHLAETVKEQSAQIQKVSAQLELNKPAPQTALNNQ